MQVVVAAPEIAASVNLPSTSETLMRPVCGVPLLIRTLATAERAGADEILFLWPEGLPEWLAAKCIASPLLRQKANIRLIFVKGFDPGIASSWEDIQGHLDSRFVWLPWNWVTQKQYLSRLRVTSVQSVDWRRPACIERHQTGCNESAAPISDWKADGIAVTSPESAAAAERFLVARSGKVLDGIHTSFNRRLCRPLVRWLSHTRITPNEVTFGGVLVSVLSAIAFAGGSYWSYVVGAAVFFIAGLFDEMDGMLARIKFADSPFGTWLEGFADGLSYLLLFGGITLGLHRQYGSWPLKVGVALLAGTLLSLIVTSLGRKRATTPDRPGEYLGRFYRLLEKDSSNWISRVVRQLQAFEKRGVIIHYVFLFTVLGGLPVLFCLATLGSHLTWILSLYFNHRFFRQPAQSAGTAGANTIREAL